MQVMHTIVNDNDGIESCQSKTVNFYLKNYCDHVGIILDRVLG